MRMISAALIAAAFALPVALPAAAHAQYRDNDRRGDHDRQQFREHDWREHDWREHEYRQNRSYYAPPGAYYAPRRYSPPPLFGLTIR